MNGIDSKACVTNIVLFDCFARCSSSLNYCCTWDDIMRDITTAIFNYSFSQKFTLQLLLFILERDVAAIDVAGHFINWHT